LRATLLRNPRDEKRNPRLEQYIYIYIYMRCDLLLAESVGVGICDWWICWSRGCWYKQ